MRLRPVQMDDAAFIVWLRNLDHAKGKLGDSATDVASQQAWLEAYFQREGDYYFIVETMSGIPVGTHSLYDIANGSAELGRWIIRPGVQAAVPSHMVAFDIAFRQLGLKEMRNVTVATNRPVISISRKFGFKQIRVEVAGRVIGGKPVDMVHFILTAQDWANTRESLVATAEVAERLVGDWERDQRVSNAGADSATTSKII
ncbi:MAG: acetyltransferase, family [Pedosphaera sp.]|nr:acetyltransferase, family [Pedosphaera sp.]